ncbi:transposase IS66 [Scytonema sp. HK-05]|nr:transposase IS66 [Scytonema sp. HK-05]
MDIIFEQAIATIKLNSRILELEQEVEKLKVSRDLDSKTSSKPPSGDILKKSENKQDVVDEESKTAKRKPGGQLGHPGKTRKGFGRVDRFEILRPEVCCCCGITMVMMSKLNRNAWHIYVAILKNALKLPGLNNQEIGDNFVKLIDEAFKNYANFQQTQNSREFFNWAWGFKVKVKSSIDEWMNKAGGEAGKLLRSLPCKTDQWWYFLDHPELSPDNNLAERTLRLAVTKRKVSGGSRSMERFKHTANLLTVVQTCRRQGRSVIEFFEQAILAMVNPDIQEPSLIPQI